MRYSPIWTATGWSTKSYHANYPIPIFIYCKFLDRCVNRLGFFIRFPNPPPLAGYLPIIELGPQIDGRENLGGTVFSEGFNRPWQDKKIWKENQIENWKCRSLSIMLLVISYFCGLSGTHQPLYVLNQNHPGYLSSKDQTRQGHLLRPDHWFWLWIVKNINAESALFTLSCSSYVLHGPPFPNIFDVLWWYLFLSELKSHLAVMTTLAPCLTASIARAAPIPVLAPVTQTTWKLFFALQKNQVHLLLKTLMTRYKVIFLTDPLLFSTKINKG